MKTPLLISIITALALTGCASTHGTHHTKGDKPHHHKHHHKDGNYHKDGKHHHKQHKHGNTVQSFQCDNGAAIKIHHLPKQDKAMAHIKAPTANIESLHLDMKAATAASGERWIAGDSNSSYEWHAKGETGVLSITHGDATQDLNCQQVPNSPLATHPNKPKYEKPVSPKIVL
ncbi:MAG: MliC family protein [Moraxella sp.]|nr:MliC family protein [Moraxella sp.]